jgi:hypothetical protein
LPLQRILSALDEPVKPKVINELIGYMKSMPPEEETLVLQCAEYLETNQTLGNVLAVVHALNGGEFLLQSIEDDTLDLVDEFEKMLSADDEKNTPKSALAAPGKPSAAQK